MRLIDADELLNKFRYSTEDTEEDRVWIATIRRTIKEQPTAYGIDKVVEKLKERSSQSCAVLFAAGIDEAISIIKAGEQE